MMRADLCRLALQPDPETVSNPYTDSWILHSSPEQNVNMVLAGIAIKTAELLPAPADRLNGKHTVVDAAGVCLQRTAGRSLSLFPSACPG